MRTRFYDTLNILIKVGNFSYLSTDDKALDWYYIVKFISGPYTIQDETVIDVPNKTKTLVNTTYRTKLRLVPNWYTQTDSTKVVIPLQIIFHLQLNVFPPIVSTICLKMYV